MIKLLADNNATGHVRVLVRILMNETWIGFWNDLELAVVTFRDLGLDRKASDADLWRTCQREQVVLITSNRNADRPDSLQTILREENRSDCLPVFTLADPERVGNDRAYAEETALRLLEYLSQFDSVRGAGRLFLP